MRQATARAAGKRGFTLIELLVVVAIIALLISILMPSLARARELSKRTVCASNVKGIGLGFASYAAANNDAWPVPNHPRSSVTDATTQVVYQKVIGRKRGNPDQPSYGESFSGATGEPSNDTHISTTRAFWLLVRNGNTPKSFVCPSATTDTPNTDDNPAAFWDFGPLAITNPLIINTAVSQAANSVLADADAKTGWSQCSYGYQVPYGKNGQPGPNVDPDMALVADKGPAGAFFEGMQTTAPASPITGQNSNSSPEEWKKYNSPNHGGYMDGEGQNVMYNDGHVEFFNSPLCGVAKDNIYSQWVNNNPSIDGRAQGTLPTTAANLAPYGVTDSLIYP